ncbi:unnamed protein product [Echinostoma caproni]|uniref:Uncharacterized protein n=1 Tax=Echinostoma caproni TaxID=27848 RepID=A0A183BBN5_9TREM|nr:unnamed protein product [Echinostoma caproni]
MCIQLQDGHFLEERDMLLHSEMKSENDENGAFELKQSENYDTTTTNVDVNPRPTFGTTLLELAAHRKRTDSNWRPGLDDQASAQLLREEIHELLETELVSDP